MRAPLALVLTALLLLTASAPGAVAAPPSRGDSSAAARVVPLEAPLIDAAGIDTGCRATLLARTKISVKGPRLWVDATLACPDHWQRYVIGLSIAGIYPDGSSSVLYPAIGGRITGAGVEPTHNFDQMIRDACKPSTWWSPVAGTTYAFVVDYLARVTDRNQVRVATAKMHTTLTASC